MKQLIHALIVTLFLALLTGCGGSSTPPQEGNIPDIQLSANHEGEDTPATIVELAADPVEGDTPVTELLVNSETETTAPVLKLSVDPAVNEILLNWDPSGDATGYRLDWSEMQDTLENSMAFDVDQTHYLHQDLEPATDYYYRITAKFGKEKETVSKVLKVRTGYSGKFKQSDVAY